MSFVRVCEACEAEMVQEKNPCINCNKGNSTRVMQLRTDCNRTLNRLNFVIADSKPTIKKPNLFMDADIQKWNTFDSMAGSASVIVLLRYQDTCIGGMVANRNSWKLGLFWSYISIGLPQELKLFLVFLMMEKCMEIDTVFIPPRLYESLISFWSEYFPLTSVPKAVDSKHTKFKKLKMDETWGEYLEQAFPLLSEQFINKLKQNQYTEFQETLKVRVLQQKPS